MITSWARTTVVPYPRFPKYPFVGYYDLSYLKNGSIGFPPFLRFRRFYSCAFEESWRKSSFVSARRGSGVSSHQSMMTNTGKDIGVRRELRYALPERNSGGDISSESRDEKSLMTAFHTSAASSQTVQANMTTNPIITANSGEDAWNFLGTPRTELRLEFTLPTGQSFRWTKVTNDTYLGVVHKRAVLLQQLDNDVAYHVIARSHQSSELFSTDLEMLEDYFNLGVDLTGLSNVWCAADPNYYAKLAAKLPGARMLRQDPYECLFSFICSQNNHISRIHGMVNRLCMRYGEPLRLPKGIIEGMSSEVYTFPTPEQLSVATEEELREDGFGYRAKYIVGAAKELSRKPGGSAAWLKGLREVSFEEAVEELCTLPGVGPKVAACAALFSLDKHSSIPVDTHIWKVATKYYTPHLRGKSLTTKLHGEVQLAFVKKFGSYAGWAHNTLFIAELPSIKSRIKKLNEKSPKSTGDSDSTDETSFKEDIESTEARYTPQKETMGTFKTTELDIANGRNDSMAPSTPVDNNNEKRKSKRRRIQPNRYGNSMSQ